jgi:hypothetical protein
MQLLGPECIRYVTPWDATWDATDDVMAEEVWAMAADQIPSTV